MQHRKKTILIFVTITLLVFAFAVRSAVQRDTNDPVPQPRAAQESPSETSTPPRSKELGIPATGTVLALAGMDFHLLDNMPGQLQGIFNKSPYTMVQVDYPRSASRTSIATGITNLDKALRSTPGQKIVLGYSQGAQVASGWMRQYAHDPSAPPASELTFVLIGNPLRSSGGYGIGRPTWDGTPGVATPTNTTWHVVDVARRYDGWADWPTDTSNKEAVDNANRGKSSIHLKYSEVNLYDPANTMWSKGNTTFVITNEINLPLFAGNKNVTRSESDAAKARIEAAYHRW